MKTEQLLFFRKMWRWSSTLRYCIHQLKTILKILTVHNTCLGPGLGPSIREIRIGKLGILNFIQERNQPGPFYIYLWSYHVMANGLKRYFVIKHIMAIINHTNSTLALARSDKVLSWNPPPMQASVDLVLSVCNLFFNHLIPRSKMQ